MKNLQTDKKIDVRQNENQWGRKNLRGGRGTRRRDIGNLREKMGLL